MKTIAKPEQFPNEEHTAAIIFPEKETGTVEYLQFSSKGELEAWTAKELSKKNGQRSFRIIGAKPLTLQAKVAGGVITAVDWT